MFVNQILTDGYTCRLVFARESRMLHGVQNTDLELGDFNTQEIDKHFIPISVDPGRTTFVTSYRQDGQIRSVGQKEFYTMSGRTPMLKKLQRRKNECGIAQLESNMPSPKTSLLTQYNIYIVYLLKHLRIFFNFYNKNTAEDNWCLFTAKKAALDEAVNILINGGKKYDRKKGRRNKKKRKKMAKKRSKKMKKGKQQQYGGDTLMTDSFKRFVVLNIQLSFHTHRLYIEL